MGVEDSRLNPGSRQSDQRSVYVQSKSRLALWRRCASAAFWDKAWHQLTDDQLQHVLRRTGRLGSLGSFLSRWLPREGVVLEAGCGTGLWVSRLRSRDYDCIGIDFTVSSLLRSKTVRPNLPLLGGDVLHLPFADGSLAAYVSFGVVEHFADGPGQALREAARVLRPGGVACVSVPYENPLRQKAPTVSERNALAQGLEFYQYYFSQRDFEAELARAGLRPVGVFRGYGVYSVLKSRVRLLSLLERFLPRKSVWTPALDLIPGLPRLAAHMMFTVALKP